jgi:hypothetical protein
MMAATLNQQLGKLKMKYSGAWTLVVPGAYRKNGMGLRRRIRKNPESRLSTGLRWGEES